ncbi:hypothetical protein [Hydrogenophaga sp.]|uniref:hypothetical protein n=1 Tax=Hydrogenophaga sp. TaxID=1904254 RepID=UPI0027244564|nr:hypothetical protein [Hydrogenophaga sp.]MDO9439177.1 hypothetical protein [Hydrogenophaga sp.]
MQIPSSKFQDWKAAEAELADIEQAFRALAVDLSPTDRARVTQQLAALRAARLRVLLLFEEVKKESTWFAEQVDDNGAPEINNRSDSRLPPGAEDWLS